MQCGHVASWKRQVKDNTYLYGTEDVPEVPAWLKQQRVNLLKKNLNRLLKEKGGVGTTRATDIVKAISFWEKLT